MVFMLAGCTALLFFSVKALLASSTSPPADSLAVSAPAISLAQGAETSAPPEETVSPEAEPAPEEALPEEVHESPLAVDGTLAAVIAQAPETDLAAWPEIAQATADSDSVAFLALDLDTGESLGHNLDTGFYIASTIKGPYCLYAFRQLDAGNGTADELLLYTEESFDDGSGEVKKSAFGTEFTVGRLLELTLTQSDNVAYRMLNKRFGTDGYNEMEYALEAPSLTFHPNIWPSKATARDLARAWNAIYAYINGEETAHSGQMRQALLSNAYSPIRKALGYQKAVASKYGWDSPSYCDCGLVYKADGTPDYLLVLLTTNAGEGSSAFARTAPLIQAIDRAMDTF